jgi:hypothetical protein
VTDDRPELLEKRKGRRKRHAVKASDPLTALCGRALDGNYETVGQFYPSSDPQPGHRLCKACNTAAQTLLWGEPAEGTVTDAVADRLEDASTDVDPVMDRVDGSLAEVVDAVEHVLEDRGWTPPPDPTDDATQAP